VGTEFTPTAAEDTFSQGKIRHAANLVPIFNSLINLRQFRRPTYLIAPSETPTRLCPSNQSRWKLSDNPITASLLVRWALRWLVDVVAASISVGWLLEFNTRLNARLLASEVSLILLAVVASGLWCVGGRSVAFYIVIVGLVRLEVGVIGGGTMLAGKPASATVWLESSLSTAAGREASEEEEDQEGDHDDDHERDPSTPVVPATVVAVDNIAEFVFAQCHSVPRVLILVWLPAFYAAVRGCGDVDLRMCLADEASYGNKWPMEVRL